MTNNWMMRINYALESQLQKQLYREREVIKDGNNRLLYNNNRIYLNFSSNDYLGLARHPEVIEAWCQGAINSGVGAGGSEYITGYSLYHQRLEHWLADWLGYPRALLFTSGFAANQAIISTLMTAGDHILADRLSHASILEAAFQSPANLLRFNHNDPINLQKLIKRNCNGNRLVITEGVFSMEGDLAPLSILIRITQSVDSWLMVDDAHGIGVIGKEGRGSTWMLENKPTLLVITFGKAVGVSGAAVLCAVPIAEYLLQFARHLIYSTALPPAQILAIHTALKILKREDKLRQKLKSNIKYFRNGARAFGFKLMPSNTAIQPLIIGDNLRAIILARRLRERGIWLTAIRSPTVPPHGARLRITLTAAHKTQDIDILLEALSNEQSDL